MYSLCWNLNIIIPSFFSVRCRLLYICLYQSCCFSSWTFWKRGHMVQQKTEQQHKLGPHHEQPTTIPTTKHYTSILALTFSKMVEHPCCSCWQHPLHNITPLFKGFLEASGTPCCSCLCTTPTKWLQLYHPDPTFLKAYRPPSWCPAG